jgi:hypothetical protein
VGFVVGLREVVLSRLFPSPFNAVELSKAVYCTADVAKTPLTRSVGEGATDCREVVDELQDSERRNCNVTPLEVVVGMRNST